MHDQLPPLAGAGGAAFLLNTPSTETTSIEQADGVVLLRSGSLCTTVQLHRPVAPEALRDECWRITQEALDVHAATHRQAFATTKGEREFITWEHGPTGYVLTATDTLQSRWSMSGTVQIDRPPGSPPPAPPPPPVAHNPALRYHRLSQLSVDLFDSFRNAYLALEHLVSEVSPKARNEPEQSWLNRVLGGPLAPYLPGGIDVHLVVESIYKFGRLPLFHAKSYDTFYLPHGNRRSEIQDTLETLQLILTFLLHYRVSCRIPAGWGQMSGALEDAAARSAYLANQCVFGYGLLRKQHDFSFEIIESPRHFGSIWGRTPQFPSPSFPALEYVEFLRDGADWISIRLPTIVPLKGVAYVQVALRQAQGNAKAPTRLHAS